MIEIRPRTGCGENSSVPGTRVLDDLDGCVRTGVGGRSTSAPARCSHSFAGQPRTGASNPPHPGGWITAPLRYALSHPDRPRPASRVRCYFHRTPFEARSRS